VKDGRNFQSVQNPESIPTYSTFAARYVVEAKQVSGDYVYKLMSSPVTQLAITL
jgi:hypothetical protein